MKISAQYITPSVYQKKQDTYSPNFGIKFRMPKLVTDVFVKNTPSHSGISKIKNVFPGKFGTQCKGSVPLEEFEYGCGLKEINSLYKKGLSTNIDAWSDAFLKSSADTPISTSSVYDCSVMYLFNKNTNTHFLYHSYFNRDRKDFDSLIKTFMPEGFTSAEILPGDSKWYVRHSLTIPEMLKAIKTNNKKAVVNVRHYSSKMPEVVGYKGSLYEIPNQRVFWGFSDKGQASFKICDLRVDKLLEEIKYNSTNPKKIEIMKKMYEDRGLNKEILKIINKLSDEQLSKAKE